MIRLKTLFTILLTTFTIGFSLNAKSLLDRYNSGNGVPKLRQMKKTDLLSIYSKSHHMRVLEAQKRAYINSARENARVFGGVRNKRIIPPYVVNIHSQIRRK